MKKSTILLAFSLLSFLAEATIYRLGFPGIPVVGKDFTYNNYGTLESTASAGDTVQVYQQYFPTPVQIFVGKPLRFFGYGFNLNVNSGYQVANLPDTTLRSLSMQFNLGSAGSFVQGLHLGGIYTSDSNITVRRCVIFNGQGTCPTMQFYSYPDNITIEGCYIRGVSDSSANANLVCVVHFNSGNSCRNFRFLNNIMSGGLWINGAPGALHTGIIANNVFFNRKGFGRHPSFYNFLEIEGFSTFFIKNNIFFYDSVKTKEVWGNSFFESQLAVPITCVFQNNVSNIPAAYNLWGATNQFGVTNLFVAGYSNGYFSTESALQLAAGSPALTAGKNHAGTATQCGVYGGESAQYYRMSGVPPIPAIYQLSAPSQNASSNPYNITISTRSNN